MATGILVLAEHLRGVVSDVTYEMLGAGRRLADELKGPLTAALFGDQVTGLASTLGAADQVVVVDHPALAMAPAAVQAALLREVRGRTDAALLLVAGTNVSIGIGPVLAARTRLSFVNFCRALRVEGGDVVVTSQLLGGKILSDVRLSRSEGIASIYPGAFPAETGRVARTPAVEKLDLPLAASNVTFQRFIEPETADVDITRQAVLVGVGRGIESQDNLALAEELAAVLGGAVCASRPVIDQGWLPLSRQVGKSGMTVKPRLYLAFGISGAPEHWEGMQAAEVIVAVNTDPQAPIFDGAHYGAVADALEVIPALTERITARKG